MRVGKCTIVGKGKGNVTRRDIIDRNYCEILAAS